MRNLYLMCTLRDVHLMDTGGEIFLPGGLQPAGHNQGNPAENIAPFRCLGALAPNNGDVNRHSMRYSCQEDKGLLPKGLLHLSSQMRLTG